MEIKTVYTKERLVNFNAAVMRSKKFVWITMGLCTVLVFACFGLLMAMGEVSQTVKLCVLMISVMDIAYLVGGFVLPHFVLAKSKMLNAELTYVFSEDHFEVNVTSAYAKETATVQYTILTKIQKRGTELYLFISNRQGYVVDLSQVPETEQQALRQLLQAKTSLKSFQWA